MSDAQATVFAGVKDVLAYLKEQGRKISQRQVYRDLKKGYLRRQPDGTFKRSHVELYASTLQAYAMPEETADAMGDLARQELEEKIKKTREQRIAITFDRQIKEGKYILREDVALELASRAITLSVGLRSVFRLYAPEYIRMVGGNADLAENLSQEFEKNLDQALNEFSKPMDFGTMYTAAPAEPQPAAQEA